MARVKIDIDWVRDVRDCCMASSDSARRRAYDVYMSVVCRMCTSVSEGLPLIPFDSHTKLYELCRLYAFDYSRIDELRNNAIAAELQKDISIDTVSFERDSETMVALLAKVSGTDISDCISTEMCDESEEKECAGTHEVVKRAKLRMTVKDWDDDIVQGYIVGEAKRGIFYLHYNSTKHTGATPFANLGTQLFIGAQLNLVDVYAEGNELFATYIVLEPDFLIDVSALAAAFKDYGFSPMNYLLTRFTPSRSSAAIILGNMANQFMDDCVCAAHHTDEEKLYEESVRKCFKLFPLSFICCQEEIGRDFFDRARQQFSHIYNAVSTGKTIGGAERFLIEHSFLCETLGLRGRMDLISADLKDIIELKSGKGDEFGGEFNPKKEHLLQALLYREAISRNFDQAEPRASTSSYLFYSHYPQSVRCEDTAYMVKKAIAGRNAIVHIERQISRGELEPFYENLVWDKINSKGRKDLFVQRYLRPPVENIIRTIQSLDTVEHKYFDAFMRFIEREMFYSKLGDNTLDSNKGFAYKWQLLPNEKEKTGDIVRNLRIEQVELDGDAVVRLYLCRPVESLSDEFVPNFVIGNFVIFYRAESATDNATNSFLTRAYIEHIDGKSIVIALLYKQRNNTYFSTEYTYAIEHDSGDMGFSQMFRGLYSFVSAPQSFRDLILGRRLPEIDYNIKLSGKYSDPYLSQILLNAKRAKDYYLLVGPPGTGKTNYVLRAMVSEFVQPQDIEEPRGKILLMAYTNRAVDEICGMLEGLGEEQYRYVRMGQFVSCPDAYKKRHINEVLKEVSNRREAVGLLGRYRIWVSTVACMTSNMDLFNLVQFDIAIIDEASQVLEPQIIGLLSVNNLGVSCIKKFIMIGDHKQLPAVVMQPMEETAVTDPDLQSVGLVNLRDSLFQRLHGIVVREQRKYPLPVLNELHLQGRMHRQICYFPSHMFYEKKLMPIDTAGFERLKAALPYKRLLPHDNSERDPGWYNFIAHNRVGFINVVPDTRLTNAKSNPYEAEIVADIIEKLAELHKLNSLSFNPVGQVGVIVPFRNQIGTIRSALRSNDIEAADDITIDTVECFQGSQRDFIIYSTTVSKHYQMKLLSAEVPVNGIMVDRKFNVAITRAREQLFVVGCRHILEQSHIYKEFIRCTNKFPNDIVG